MKKVISLILVIATLITLPVTEAKVREVYMYNGEEREIGNITEIPDTNVCVNKLSRTRIKATHCGRVSIYVNNKKLNLVILPKSLPLNPSIVKAYEKDKVYFIYQEVKDKGFVTVYNVNPYCVNIMLGDEIVTNLYQGRTYTFPMTREKFDSNKPSVEKSSYEISSCISSDVKNGKIRLENDDERECYAHVSYVVVRDKKIVKAEEKTVTIKGISYTYIETELKEKDKLVFVSLTGWVKNK